MARKVMDELADMMVDNERQEEISDRLLQKAVQERNIRLILNDRIHTFIRKENKHIGEINKADFDRLSEGLPEHYQGLLMQQFMRALKTNRGKSIQRIRENHKSVLLDQLD
jgi:hypothetical protein